jgi:hypothetical protein
MANGYYHDILMAQGFELLGSIHYDQDFILWWNPNLHIEVSLVELDGAVLLRAAKHYRLQAWGQNGELYSRDLEQFHEFLTTHFEELHMTCSSVRDLTPSLVRRQIQEKKFGHLQDKEDVTADMLAQHLQELSDDFNEGKALLQRDEGLLQLDRGRSPLLQRYLQNQIGCRRRQLEQFRTEAKTIHDQLAVQKHLENEYIHKGEAVCLLFTICSNIQFIQEKEEFTEALNSVVTEIQNAHTYQIRQKLQGGKLNIYVNEISAPGVSLLTRWAGAALNPRELVRLNPKFAAVCKNFEEDYMVFAQKDILLAGAIQEEKKLVGARIIRNFFKRLEVVPAAPARTDPRPKSSMPVWIGNTSDGGTRIDSPWELPLEKMGHVYISGTTGAGKTFLAFVIVEGALAYPDLSIIVLTPNHQWVGLKCAEDRPEVLERYKLFGLKPEQARGFNFKYYGIGQGIGEPLPKDLRRLATGLHVLSFKYSDDRSRCEISANVLQSIFDARSCSESSKPQGLIIIDEAPRFTRKHVCKEAQSAAAESEKAINLITAEGRKYGLSAILLSQTLRHFSYDLAAVRQNLSTRIFMRNSDGEIDHASQFMDDGREILRLRTGEAFICNQEWGCVKILVRPPLCKAWEPTDAEVKKLVSSTSEVEQALSKEAQLILDIACTQYYQTGQPVRLAVIAEQAGVTSRRKLNRIVDELKEASAVKFEYLNERGKPLVIMPVNTQKTNLNRT